MGTERTEARFRAMNAEITIQGVGISRELLAAATAEAREHVAAWEALFSRFLPASLLSQLNRDGQVTGAPAIFIELMESARNAVHRSGGVFEPAILPALSALGYDRSYELIQEATTHAELTAAPASRWNDVLIDRSSGSVHLPPGMQIDLGGIGKGAWVDSMAKRFSSSWPGGCINAGGDIAVWGESPDDAGWCIGIENPASPSEDLLVMSLRPGDCAGIATSGTNRRTWKGLQGPLHHLIDPRTGRPARTVWQTVTAVAASTTVADVAAKTILIAGDSAIHDLYDCDLVITLDDQGRAFRHDRTMLHEPLVSFGAA